ncbi:MAG: hypothetical protein JWM02_375 [Frankiales bacterium]|nr:hypothetical protein [Frankiales bacterium]
MSVAVAVVLFHPEHQALDLLVRTLAAWQHGPVLVHVNHDPQGRVGAEVSLRLPAASVSGSPVNDGFAGAQNELLKRAFEQAVDAVVVHNPDLVLEPGAVEVLSLVSESLASPALLGPALQLADPDGLAPAGQVDTLGIVWTRSGRHLDSHQGDPWSDPVGGPVPVAGISGACLFVSRSAYQAVCAVGGEFFDADFIAYREDAELAFRAALLGVPSFLVPGATGRHGRGLRGTQRGGGTHVDLLGVRNRFLIAFKYGRQRPGGVVGPFLRDLVVLAAVLTRERSSLPGVVEAWRLRREMRAKGRAVLAAARLTSREATRL